jgi:hypothetical protein
MERQPGERDRERKTANGETAMVASHHQERAALISSADTIYQALYDYEYRMRWALLAATTRPMLSSKTLKIARRNSNPVIPHMSTHHDPNSRGRNFQPASRLRVTAKDIYPEYIWF